MNFNSSSEPSIGSIRKKNTTTFLVSAGNGGHMIVPVDNMMMFIPM